MRPTPRPARVAGQVVVEAVAVATVVAALLVLTGAWLAQQLRPASPGPRLLDAVAAPLEADVRAAGTSVAAALGDLARWRDDGDEPIGALLRGSGAVAPELGLAVGRGFTRRLRRRGVELSEDPLGTLSEVAVQVLLDGRPTTERASGRDVLGRELRRELLVRLPRAFRRARELRGRPPREVAVAVAEDLGAELADEAISRLTRGAARAVLGRRTGRDTPPREGRRE